MNTATPLFIIHAYRAVTWARLHTWYLPVPFVCHVMSANTAVLPQHSGVGANIARLQECNVGLTHCDVLLCGVRVQLLMPCLQKVAFNAL